MALTICDEKVGVAIAKHPPPKRKRVQSLEPIPYISSKKTLYKRKTSIGHEEQDGPHSPLVLRVDENERVALEIGELVKQHNVCGFVVGWPLHPEGRPGGQCGKVLHLLDHIAEHSDSIIYLGRPFALMDLRDVPFNDTNQKMNSIMKSDFDEAQQIDEWGRCAIYGQTPSESMGSHVFRPGEQLYYPSIADNDSRACATMLRQYMQRYCWEESEEHDTSKSANVESDDSASEHTTSSCTYERNNGTQMRLNLV
mmetsp:Transcript_18600/g.37325  ORF Transcript_18600/g.37325 Transcript_18600/m.37325 type:complete len:254 (-) Transcript_18600:70-831(-)